MGMKYWPVGVGSFGRADPGGEVEDLRAALVDEQVHRREVHDDRVGVLETVTSLWCTQMVDPFGRCANRTSSHTKKQNSRNNKITNTQTNTRTQHQKHQASSTKRETP